MDYRQQVDVVRLQGTLRARQVAIMGCLGLLIALGATGIVNARTAAGSPAYVQLVFSASAEECKARLKRVLGKRQPGQSARCLRNVSDQAGQPPAAAKLQPYMLEVIGQGASVPQPDEALAADTVTFRALGNAQVTDNAKRADHQPVGTGAVGSYRMYVFTNPVAGQDATYNDWYDRQHIPDVLKVPGFVAGQRFAMVDPEQHNPVKLPRYLALFDLQSRGLAATDAEILARGRDGRTVGSSSFDLKSGVVAYMVADAAPPDAKR